MVQLKRHHFQDYALKDSPEITVLHMQIFSLQISRAVLPKNMSASALKLSFSLKVEAYTRLVDMYMYMYMKKKNAYYTVLPI
jgi:hypothetical protein